MKIYIAGPYSSDNVIGVLSNIRRGIEMSARLLDMGYSIFCPWLDFQFALTDFGRTITKEDYQRNSMAWLEVSEAVLVIGDWFNSEGVKKEIARAWELNIPVYYSLGEMLESQHDNR